MKIPVLAVLMLLGAPPVYANPGVSVTPEESLTRLKTGNQRFVAHKLRNDGVSLQDVERTAAAQHPHAIVLGCSDSRVSPEIIFDQKIGEIFTVRTAGEIADTVGIASIEYAVEHLGSRLIVVMGHTSCGAVNAAIHAKKNEHGESTSLDSLIHEVQRHLGDHHKNPVSKNIHDESLRNAHGVKTDLIRKSPIIGKAVDSGKVKVIASIYDLSTGKVEWAPAEKERQQSVVIPD